MAGLLNPIVCFYHIEKCGGTTIRKCLRTFLEHVYSPTEIEDSGVEEHKRFANKTPEEISAIKVLMAHQSFGHFPVSMFDAEIRITVVRDPIERIVSHYYYFDKTRHGTGLDLDKLPQENLLPYLHGQGSHMTYRFSPTRRIADAVENARKFTCILFLSDIENGIRVLERILQKRFGIADKIHLSTLNETKVQGYGDAKQRVAENIRALALSLKDISLYRILLDMRGDKPAIVAPEYDEFNY